MTGTLSQVSKQLRVSVHEAIDTHIGNNVNDSEKCAAEDRSDIRKEHYRTRKQTYIDVTRGSEGWQVLPNWFIQDLIYVGAVGILAGDTQSFKTFVALRLAQAIANGTEFAGHGVDQGAVLYVVAEGAAGIALRMRALEDAYGSVDDRILFVKQPIDIRNHFDSAHIASIVSKQAQTNSLPVRLLIIDTLSQSTWDLEENHSGEMADFFKYCDEFAQQHNIAILIVHHVGKNGTMRGSSVMKQNVAFLWKLERHLREEFTTTLSVDKNKEGPSNVSLRFNLEVFDAGIQDRWGNVTTLRVCHERKMPKSLPVNEEKKPKPLSKIQTDIRWLLSKLLNEVENAAILTQIRKMFIEELELGYSQGSTRFKRATDDMINKRLLIKLQEKSERIQLTEAGLAECRIQFGQNKQASNLTVLEQIAS